MLKLGDCCRMQTGVPVLRHDFDRNGDTQVVQLRDVDADGCLLSPLARVRLQRKLEKDNLIQVGDVILKGRGANITAALIEEVPGRTVASSAYFILRSFNRQRVLPAFLAWYLRNMRLPLIRSASMPLLQIRDLKEMPVRLPAPEVQQQVVEADRLRREGLNLANRYHKAIGRLLKGIVLSAEPDKQGYPLI